MNSFHVSSINSSRLAHGRIADYYGLEYKEYQFEGSLIGMLKDGPVHICIGDLIPAVSGWFTSLNGVAFNVKRFCNWVGGSVAISDVCSFFNPEHGLKQEECLALETCCFDLPTTMDGYVTSLKKRARYDYRETEQLCQDLTWSVVQEIKPWLKFKDQYENRMLTKFKYTKEHARDITESLEIAIRTLIDQGNAHFVVVTAGSRLVALSIAERIGQVVHDHTCIWEPDMDDHFLGRYTIYKGIEHAIRTSARVYDIGHVWNDPDLHCDFSYKRSFVPKDQIRTRQVLNFMSLTREGKAHLEKTSPFKLYPPYYLDGVLITP